jgi:hypothetical protein
LVPLQAGLFIKILKNMFDKKQNAFKSPDLSKLREVIIDHRTRIYIAPGADIEEARNRYLSRITTKRTK